MEGKSLKSGPQTHTPEIVQMTDHVVENGPGSPARRKKFGGRKRGTPNKKTLAKIAAAEAGLVEARAGKKLAVDYMDEMIEWFRHLTGQLQPFDKDGNLKPGRDARMWLRVVECFQAFLSMRAPYQSPRLSAVAIMPQQARQRTTVNVTILNDRGERVYSDRDDAGDGEDAKLIEHQQNARVDDDLHGGDSEDEVA
jgi:hypothetical protein